MRHPALQRQPYRGYQVRQLAHAGPLPTAMEERVVLEHYRLTHAAVNGHDDWIGYNFEGDDYANGIGEFYVIHATGNGEEQMMVELTERNAYTAFYLAIKMAFQADDVA